MPTDEKLNLDPMPTDGHASAPIGKSAKTEDAPGSVPFESTQGQQAGSRPIEEGDKKPEDNANNPPKPPDTQSENGQSVPPSNPTPVIPPKPGQTPVD